VSKDGRLLMLLTPAPIMSFALLLLLLLLLSKMFCWCTYNHTQAVHGNGCEHCTDAFDGHY